MSDLIERLREVLDYDPDTGAFTWKVNLTSRARAGKAAGHIRNNGYHAVKIDGRNYMAHRLAWLMTYGKWPDHEIDHINGLRNDNRLSNLRDATRAENGRNLSVRSNNTSGIKGVYWSKRNQRWLAQITVNQKTKYLGIFKDVEKAKEAYSQAAAELHGEFMRVG